MKHIGETVTYVDHVGVEHQALLTAVWDETEIPTVNLVYVSDKEDERDQYGRQIRRETSIVHQSRTTAPGFFWK